MQPDADSIRLPLRIPLNEGLWPTAPEHQFPAGGAAVNAATRRVGSNSNVAERVATAHILNGFCARLPLGAKFAVIVVGALLEHKSDVDTNNFGVCDLLLVAHNHTAVLRYRQVGADSWGRSSCCGRYQRFMSLFTFPIGRLALPHQAVCIFALLALFFGGERAVCLGCVRPKDVGRHCSNERQKPNDNPDKCRNAPPCRLIGRATSKGRFAARAHAHVRSVPLPASLAHDHTQGQLRFTRLSHGPLLPRLQGARCLDGTIPIPSRLVTRSGGRSCAQHAKPNSHGGAR